MICLVFNLVFRAFLPWSYPTDDSQDRVGEGKSYNWLALAQMDAGRSADALSAAHSALEIAQDLESRKLEADALQLLSKVHVFKEKSRPAVQYAERSLAVCRKMGQGAKCEGGALRLLVTSLVQRGDLKRALKEAEGALEDYDASGNKRSEAAAHGALAHVRQARNELDLAASEQNQELDILRELGDKHGLVDGLLVLSSIYAAMKKAGLAKEKAEEAKQLADDTQDKKAEVLATIALVNAQLVEQKNDDAANTAQEALRAAQETEDRRLEANALAAISKVSTAKGEHATAVSKLSEAKSLLIIAGDRRDAAATLLLLADAHLRNQAADEAIASAEEARDLCKELDFKKGLAEALRKLAGAHLAKGDEAEAIKQALVAKKYCKAIEDVRGETAVLHFLASTSLQRGDKSGQEAQGKKQDSQAGIEANRRHRNSAHEAVKRTRLAVDMAKKNHDPYAEAWSCFIKFFFKILFLVLLKGLTKEHFLNIRFFHGKSEEASAMAHLAHALAILNRGPEALTTCKRAEDIFRECGAVSDQATVVCLSAEISNLMGNKQKVRVEKEKIT